MSEGTFAVLGIAIFVVIGMLLGGLIYRHEMNHIARCQNWYADNPSEAERCVRRHWKEEP